MNETLLLTNTHTHTQSEAVSSAVFLFLSLLPGGSLSLRFWMRRFEMAPQVASFETRAGVFAY